MFGGDLGEDTVCSFGAHLTGDIRFHHQVHRACILGKLLVVLRELLEDLLKGTRIHRLDGALEGLVEPLELGGIRRDRIADLKPSGGDLEIAGELVHLERLLLLGGKDVRSDRRKLAIVALDELFDLLADPLRLAHELLPLHLHLLRGKLQVEDLIRQVLLLWHFFTSEGLVLVSR